MPEKLDHLTADFCETKAKECLRLARQQNISGPQRIMLEHIAETWHRIADNFLVTDA